MGVLLLLLTTGCGTVVYTVNPDVSPQMSPSEARDAVELSLSLIENGNNIESMTTKENEIDITFSGTGTFNPANDQFRHASVQYVEIKTNILKIGQKYAVHLNAASPGRGMIMLFWKSEEDAKQFVNAVSVLQKKNYGQKQRIKTANASVPVTKADQSTGNKDYGRQSKLDIPDLDNKKDSSVVLQKIPSRPPLTKTPVVKNPPKIMITSPDITRTVSVDPKRTSISVAGKAESDSGISDVLVNGDQVDLDEKGNFVAEIMLKVGQNSIVVKAIDISKSETVRQFIVTREGRKKSAVAISETTFPQPSVVAADTNYEPKIVITSPDVTRAISITAKVKHINVIGKAESNIGIMDVRINDQEASVDENGRFSAEIPLKIGQNQIVVTAVDVRRNQAIKKFTINREAGKIATAEPEVMLHSTGIQSAKYYALFIAVQDYTSHEISKLDYPVSDARQIMETLVTKYTFEKENVTFLQDPDRRTVYKTFQDLRKRLTEKDNLLIFYAGHGVWMDDMKQGFWLPKDAAGLNDPSDWISNSNIRDYIKAIKAKHVLLVADACFSGGIFRVRDAFSNPKTSVEKIYQLPSRKAITSGAMKTVPDRSVFVEFLVKRLKSNQDPYLDTQKLFASLREAVINNSVTNQTPLYGAISEAGDEGGDFILVLR